MAIHRVFGLKYAIYGVTLTFSQGAVPIFQTVVMGWMVKQLAEIDKSKAAGASDQVLDGMKMQTYLYGVYLMILQATMTLLVHPYYFSTYRMGMDVRIACCHLVYRKSLRLSKASLAQTTIGQIVTLISNDVNRFDWLLNYPHFLLIGPLMTVVTTLILYYWEAFGNECLPGIAILVLYIPFQSILGRLFTNLRVKTASLTDERVRITNEFVKAIKVIKMYAWEEPFCKMISDARKREVEMIKRASFLRGLNLGLFFVATKVIMFIMLFLYVGDGKLLNSSSVFVAMSLINQLRSAVCLYIPYAVSIGAESLISISRIEKFLLLHEYESTRDAKTGDDEASVPGSKKLNHDPRVELKNVTASYYPDCEDDEVLSNISLVANPGELIAVVGEVGAGKTSVLMTILEELPIVSGDMVRTGRVSYAPQEAWIVPGSIRDNITFGSKMDPRKYEKVVQVCALERDFTLLKHGDKTIVGDTGLSGGQKARVNLARALYHDADIYLLDDPLSAVDAAVATHIFDQAIRGFLKDRIVILITHQLQFVKSATKILLLKAGRQQVFGDYSDLLSKGIDFIKFVPTNDTAGNQETVTDDSGNTSASSMDSSSGDNPIANPLHTRVGLSRQTSTVSRSSIRSSGSIRSAASSFSQFRKRSGSWKLGSMLNVVPSEHYPSVISKEAAADRTAAAVDTDTDAEIDMEPSMEENSVASAKAYGVYLQAGGGCTALLVIIMFMGSAQILFTFSDWWLSVWTDYVESDQKHSRNESSLLSGELHRSPVLGASKMVNIYIYSGQTVLILFLAIARTIIFFIVCMRSSVRLHDRLFQRLSRAPMFFFDNNPVGILLNRCSRDMGIIDDIMPTTMFDAMSVVLVDMGCAIMICLVDGWIALPTAVVLILSFFARKLYIETARGVKRLEGVTRSPVLTHIATSLKGVSTIRAFNAEPRFNLQFDVHQDNHSAAWFHFLSSSRWFGVTLDWLCFVYIAAITISMLAKLEKGSLVGLVITSAILLQSGYQWAIRQSTEVETQMTSVERVDEYSHLESEGLLVSADPLERPKKEWPTSGKIEFDNASMRYSPRGNFVLQNLKIGIRAKEKIGIVGRTGAGKSSIINALFRLTEVCEGSIVIDGIDISRIGLHELRKKISIIPQEPVLFSGSIRKNLDPFDEKSDGKVWRALDEVHLRETVQDISKGLEAFTSEEKQHFSVGQRQLLCLARAILRGNRVSRAANTHTQTIMTDGSGLFCFLFACNNPISQILILDEATANVDPK